MERKQRRNLSAGARLKKKEGERQTQRINKEKERVKVDRVRHGEKGEHVKEKRERERV